MRLELEIPDGLFQLIQERAEKAGLTPEKFILDLLSQQLGWVEEEELSPEEEEKIRQRLRELGYIE